MHKVAFESCKNSTKTEVFWLKSQLFFLKNSLTILAWTKKRC